MKRVFIACCLSALAILLCLVGGPFLVAIYVVEGAVKGVRETAVAVWAFARLPWAV